MWCNEAKRQTRALRVIRKKVSSSSSLFDTLLRQWHQPLPLEIARTTKYYANLNDFLYLFSSSSSLHLAQTLEAVFILSFFSLFCIIMNSVCTPSHGCVFVCMKSTDRKFSEEYVCWKCTIYGWIFSAAVCIDCGMRPHSAQCKPSSTCINWWWLLVKLCDDILSRPLRSCYRINSDTKMDFFCLPYFALRILLSLLYFELVYKITFYFFDIFVYLWL